MNDAVSKIPYHAGLCELTEQAREKISRRSSISLFSTYY